MLAHTVTRKLRPASRATRRHRQVHNGKNSRQLAVSFRLLSEELSVKHSLHQPLITANCLLPTIFPPVRFCIGLSSAQTFALRLRIDLLLVKSAIGVVR